MLRTQVDNVCSNFIFGVLDLIPENNGPDALPVVLSSPQRLNISASFISIVN